MIWRGKKHDADDFTCPYTGHKRLCRDLRSRCPKWVKLVGHHPQTGIPMDEWACVDTWLPILLVENAKESRQTAAAIESFRNETVRVGEMIGNLAALAIEDRRALVARQTNGGGDEARDHP